MAQNKQQRPGPCGEWKSARRIGLAGGSPIAKDDLFWGARRSNKYGVAPRSERQVGDHVYASKSEKERAAQLQIALRAGLIRDLKEQTAFPLVVNGVKVGSYRADFTYLEQAPDGSWIEVVEDVKGVLTPVFVLKRALMLAIYGVTIRETRAGAGARSGRPAGRARTGGRNGRPGGGNLPDRGEGAAPR